MLHLRYRYRRSEIADLRTEAFQGLPAHLSIVIEICDQKDAGVIVGCDALWTKVIRKRCGFRNVNAPWVVTHTGSCAIMMP